MHGLWEVRSLMVQDRSGGGSKFQVQMHGLWEVRLLKVQDLGGCQIMLSQLAKWPTTKLSAAAVFFCHNTSFLCNLVTKKRDSPCYWKSCCSNVFINC